MIQQFLKVKDSIKKILKDISSHLICSDDEIDILLDIVALLKSSKEKALNQQDPTLLTTEGFLKFLMG